MPRKIKATITLYERVDESTYSHTDHDLVETTIDITLPVPDPEALPQYLADQIYGFLVIAGELPGTVDEGAQEPTTIDEDLASGELRAVDDLETADTSMA